MQIFFFSQAWTLALCFILWPIFQVLAAMICLKMPDKYFSHHSFFYKERKWEKGGSFYEKVFKVRKWKGLLPDGAAVTKSGYKKKHLRDFSTNNLERFLIESCRAELTHLLAIFPFWVFGLFVPVEITACMLVYALIINLPCIIAQRYNRPKIYRLLISSLHKTTVKEPLPNTVHIIK
jgi:glycosyl-4,4'-diaponeurosporenoate acyltransferase